MSPDRRIRIEQHGLPGDVCSDDCPFYTPHLGEDDFCQDPRGGCESREAEGEAWRETLAAARREARDE